MTERPALLERDLILLVRDLMSLIEPNSRAAVEPRLGPSLSPDLVIDRPEQPALVVEIKLRAPMTWSRINDVTNQLKRYGEAWEASSGTKPELLLVTPLDVLTFSTKGSLSRRGITVWDEREFIARLYNADDESLSASARHTKHVLLTRSSYAPPSTGSSDVGAREALGDRLRSIDCGGEEWSRYQRLCADILTYLFCPPLEVPLYESSNESGVNRRDIILPNYATDGFWRFLRGTYSAEYVVVDAKNHCGPGAVKKDHVLQLANYLTAAGTGLFGMILTRQRESGSAKFTRREQWLIHRKMILTLTDDDLHQMIASRNTGSPPEEVVRQKLQDFRLSI